MAEDEFLKPYEIDTGERPRLRKPGRAKTVELALGGVGRERDGAADGGGRAAQDEPVAVDGEGQRGVGRSVVTLRPPDLARLEPELTSVVLGVEGIERQVGPQGILHGGGRPPFALPRPTAITFAGRRSGPARVRVALAVAVACLEVGEHPRPELRQDLGLEVAAEQDAVESDDQVLESRLLALGARARRTSNTAL